MCYKIFSPINKEGYISLGVLIIATCISFAISWCFGIILLFLTIGCAFFFRDPVRIIPIDTDAILSPADGVIYNIRRDDDEVRISIFLSVMNVHVNRVPISGIVKKLVYTTGKFVRASSYKDSEDNERQDIVVTTASGVDIKFAQIAGFIARRIVCELKEGEQVTSGQRFGIIKFGSRVDIIIPNGIAILVAEGQTVIGGETILADLSSERKSYEYRAE